MNRQILNRGLAAALLLLVAVAGWGGYTFFIRPLFLPSFFHYAVADQAVVPDEGPPVPVKPPITHLSTPSAVRAIYMTSWVAGTPRVRERLVTLIDETELNSVVIDIKDYTGRIAFLTGDPTLDGSGAVEKRIADIEDFIRRLHAKNIYVIGRVSVFQDSYFVGQHPELAVHRSSDPSRRSVAEVDGGVWKDRKGISWLEVGATPVWNYIVQIARAAHAVGFDEINFDYIRFPSDGDMKDISYKYFDPARETRAAVLKRFYAHLSQELSPLRIPLSVDLFGLTTTSLDDLGIGQVLLDAAPYFDYIAPMVYPSHFATGFLGFSKPATKPYEVVNYAMTEASKRLLTASSTPVRHLVGSNQLRPWLQDFDLGADYTAAMVRAQIQATYDAGLTSWMLWSPSNHYTREALRNN
ncbi:MAG: putative glycoside hydrolase [Patescibacteria group bacterium]